MKRNGSRIVIGAVVQDMMGKRMRKRRKKWDARLRILLSPTVIIAIKKWGKNSASAINPRMSAQKCFKLNQRGYSCTHLPSQQAVS